MKDLNAVFQPEKIRHAHGLQISYLHDEQMRNLFVYHEDGYVGRFLSAGSLTFALLGVESDVCNVLNFCLSFGSSAKLTTEL